MYENDPTEMEYVTTEYVIVSVAARMMGYNVSYVRRLLKQGELEGIKMPDGRWLIPRHAVERFMNIYGRDKHDE